MNPELDRAVKDEPESRRLTVTGEQLSDFLMACFKDAVVERPDYKVGERVQHIKTGIDFEMSRSPKLSSKKHRGVRYLEEKRVDGQTVYSIVSRQHGWTLLAFMPINKEEVFNGVA